ncbi:probable cytochrome P450 6a14 [Euwallacea similis]|uniref:probable cytochrome P450 6a14 n=1 Tax=Euwallacea similis TaxID=1736056 RepID=UPI00344E7898
MYSNTTMIGFVILLLIVLLVAYLPLKRKHSYWTRRGVLQIEPNFLFGNFRDVALGKNINPKVIMAAYKAFKKAGVQHGGIYMTYCPLWIPVDLKLIKQIMNNDSSYFAGHGYFYKHKDDILSNNLFSAEGRYWKELRSKLTPTFTCGKLKLMFEILKIIGDKLEKKMDNLYLHKEPLNVKEVAACFSTDVIASCLFGVESNTLNEPSNDFRKYGKKVFETGFFWELLQMFVNWNMLNFFGYSWLSKDVNKFFIKLVKDIIQYREQNSIIRNDFLHLLLELRKIENIKRSSSFTLNDITANVFLMYVAGFETTSSTISFLMYELAIHQDIQEKVRKEILKVLAEVPDGHLTYDHLQKMNYCDKVIQETLRRHSVASHIPRLCTTDYKIPDSNVIIQKGTNVLIPSWSIHNDTEFFPNPEQFDPENFSEESKAARPKLTFLAFGKGPRQCFGMRFAYLELKLTLVKYLKNYKYSLNEKTPKEIEYHANPITIEPKGKILLDISQI